MSGTRHKRSRWLAIVAFIAILVAGLITARSIDVGSRDFFWPAR